MPKIFDPFFTTKAASGGSGLGLSVVKKIIDLHGGTIEIRNAPQGGVVAVLLLRGEREESLSPPPERERHRLRCHGRRWQSLPVPLRPPYAQSQPE